MTRTTRRLLALGAAAIVGGGALAVAITPTRPFGPATRATGMPALTRIATSSDGGTTWSHFRVSKAGFDPSTWGVPSSSALGYRPFIGDYNGIVSTDAFAGMVWTGVAPPQPFNLEVYFSKATP